MIPTLTLHASRATLEADPDFLRLVLTEARRSGQAQLSAYGVTTSWRNHWTGKIKLLDQCLDQLPRVEGEIVLNSDREHSPDIPHVEAEDLDLTLLPAEDISMDEDIDLLS